jgi:hypothetical protein
VVSLSTRSTLTSIALVIREYFTALINTLFVLVAEILEGLTGRGIFMSSADASQNLGPSGLDENAVNGDSQFRRFISPGNCG